MRLNLSQNDGVPIYLQIVNQVKYLVAAGRLSPGEELPPIRALAEQLTINPNTVARAYRELEAAGVVEKRRTNGTYVSDAGSPMARRERLRVLTERIDVLLAEARQLDVSTDDIIELLRQRDRIMRPVAPGSDRMVATTRISGQAEATSAPAVELRDVSRQFGGKVALDRISLTVPTGSVLGLVGENGAGETTLIRHVLGLLRAQSGTVRVFGLDPVTEPVAVLSRVGYLSEEPDMPAWMRIHELMRYVAGFYPTWDAGYAEQLRRDFGLDPMKRVKELSKGQRARAGLVMALAYRPDLLVLDEPSSGLDPIVRRDILGAIIRTIAEDGRTVLFSSHLLTEVERVSDRIAMIKSGRVLFCDTPEEIHRNHLRVTLRFDTPREMAPRLESALTWEGAGREWTAIVTAASDGLEPALLSLGGAVVERHPVTLDEIFVARSGGNPATAEEE